MDVRAGGAFMGISSKGTITEAGVWQVSFYFKHDLNKLSPDLRFPLCCWWVSHSTH
jgi:hypothetical protein